MIRDQLFPHLLTAYCLLLSLCPLWLKPGAAIDGVSFVDCIFRGVRLVQNRERLFSSPSGRGWVRVPTCQDSDRIDRGSSPTSGVPDRVSRLGWGGEGGRFQQPRKEILESLSRFLPV